MQAKPKYILNYWATLYPFQSRLPIFAYLFRFFCFYESIMKGVSYLKIVQTFNNNIVLTTNGHDEEIVVMGKGIGFQKRAGDQIDPALIDKTFVLSENVSKSIFPDIYHQLSEEEMDVVVEIIDLAENQLNVKFQSNLYIALADHIHFTLERAEQVLPLTNPLNYEVKKYYPKEYQIGKQALNLIEERLGVSLYKDEAASIALHFVTGQKEGYLVSQTIKVTEIVHNIISLVRINFNTTFNEDSVSYARFLTHLQYFAHRVVFGEVEGEVDSFLYDQVQKSYPKSFECVQKIKQYMNTTHKYDMGEDEQVYLTIHIERIMSERSS